MHNVTDDSKRVFWKCTPHPFEAGFSTPFNKMTPRRNQKELPDPLNISRISLIPAGGFFTTLLRRFLANKWRISHRYRRYFLKP